jgi:hypothetical protein
MHKLRNKDRGARTFARNSYPRFGFAIGPAAWKGGCGIVRPMVGRAFLPADRLSSRRLEFGHLP